MREKFLEFFQRKVVKGRPTTLQELVIDIVFKEPRILEFLMTRGSGKTTLFNALETFFDAKTVITPKK